MQYKSNKGFTGLGQFAILIVFLFGFIGIGSLIQVIVGMSLLPAGTPITEMGDAMLKAMQQPENVNTIRLLQVISTLIIFFIPAVMYTWVCHGKEPFWLGVNRYFNPYQIVIGFLIIFAANIMAGPLHDLSEKFVSNFPNLDQLAKKLEDTYNEQVNLLSNIKGIGDFFLALLIMAFFPALFEELFFRGALQSLLVKWWGKPLMAILVSSIVFSLIHMSIYLFLSRLALGFALGLMFYQTKNIWINTIAHFLNNAIAVAEMYSMSGSKEKIDLSKLDPKVDWWMGLIALLVLIGLFKFLQKYSESNLLKIKNKEKELSETYQHNNPFPSETLGTDQQ